MCPAAEPWRGASMKDQVTLKQVDLPATAALPEQGRVRSVIEAVSPQIDGGRFPAKRIVGEPVRVEADVFADGHDTVLCRVLYRRAGDAAYATAPMEPVSNDRFTGTFTPARVGRWEYTIEGWVDRFETWRRDLRKRKAAGQDLAIELIRGERLVQEAAARATGEEARWLAQWATRIADTALDQEQRCAAALDAALSALVRQHPDLELLTRHEPWLQLIVDRERARYSTWYELFPRSSAREAGMHGTLRDAAARLPAIAAMGFDVLYLPPIHPIGETGRKGANNATQARPGEPGSPWAIGSRDGGHDTVHPQLGTPQDVRFLIAEAAHNGIELAIDVAFQCSPDHPYVAEHPDWFQQRPDGTIQYAENPPKKYQDIYPFDFESRAWRTLWLELKSILDFWIGHGVRIFRVDNPHTKPFAFWEWAIGEVKREHPDVIFLAEAFTRPKVMHRLAKLGFTQSYTYFAWRNTHAELKQYFTELTQGPGREYFRPNAWPNTPDILPEYLQFGGRPAFMVRLVLAATLAASYGIYGPAFELLEHEPREPGSEEYRDSEKYQIRHWEPDRPESLRDFVARVNAIRRDNPALQSDWSLRFHPVDNEALLCYSKTSPDGTNMVFTVVNLDPHHAQTGWIDLPLEELGLDPARPFQAHDLLSDARFLWHGARNYVALDPQQAPAHVFRLRRRVRSEHDFDYFM
jgi:starch synthase (maltosyl-transferring)